MSHSSLGSIREEIIKACNKTKIINNVLRQKQIKTQEVIYVGDETRDIEASKKANVKICSVTWGFNSEEALAKENPDFLIHHPRELVEIVKNDN